MDACKCAHRDKKSPLTPLTPMKPCKFDFNNITPEAAAKGCSLSVPKAAQKATPKSPAVKSAAVKSTAVKSAAVKSAAVKTPAVKSTAMKSAAVKSNAMKSAAVKTPAVKTPSVKTAAVKSTAMKSAAMKTPAVKSLAVRSAQPQQLVPVKKKVPQLLPTNNNNNQQISVNDRAEVLTCSTKEIEYKQYNNGSKVFTKHEYVVKQELRVNSVKYHMSPSDYAKPFLKD